MADEEEVQEFVGEIKAPVRIERQTNILQHDGSKAFANDVLEMAQVVLDQFTEGYNYKDVATKLKRKLDEVHSGTWHVIVGPHFGVNVTNDAETLINMKINEMYILVFRSGPPERPVDPSMEEKKD